MRKIRFGIIGVGRLGYEHACNLASRIPGAELTAICNRTEKKAREAAEKLGVSAVYTDPRELCADPNVDAVAIVTNTASHVEMIRIAMEAGKHVFCEKPLAMTVEECREAEAIIKAHPGQIFMLGFMRRFDYSYEVAKRKIDNGDIGSPILIRCYSQDPRAIIKGTLEYGPRSGGVFIDLAIHDIDLVLWLSGSEPEKLWAIGGCYEFPQFKEWGDGDNVSCLMQMKNQVMAYFFAGRYAAHGAATETEIVGTKGMLRIASTPADSMVEVFSEHGVSRECYQDFLTRWHESYIREIEAFCEAVRSGVQPVPGVCDGTRATEIALRCRESFLTNSLIVMD